jgi:hypothetical protein
MTGWQKYALCAGLTMASTVGVNAGPCTVLVDRTEAEFNAKLDRAATRGPSATESSAALMHRQPTPSSIAEEESKLGDISPATIDAIKSGLARARDADRLGNPAGCERALNDIKGILNR